MSTLPRLRAAVRSLLPPIAVELLGRTGLTRNQWTGDYASWKEAAQASTGYDTDAIFERVRDAARRVQRGEAAYERDSVLFDKIEYSWPLLSALLWIAAREGRLDVLDFGGALGSSYRQNRLFLDALPCTWSVVEQAHVVACGKAEFADERLRFYETMEACVAERVPNVVVLSSVLQYLESPSEWIDRLAEFPYSIIDLTPTTTNARHRLTVQTVPPTIYPARYPCWIFSEPALRTELERHFEIIVDFDCALGDAIRVGRETARYRGFLLQRRRRA